MDSGFWWEVKHCWQTGPHQHRRRRRGGRDARARRPETNGSIARLGVIALSDSLKPDSSAAVRELHDMKLRTVLLTGDNEAAARAIAQTVGIDDVRANVRPDEKAKVVRELQDRKSAIPN
jgi:cation transport ATPase